MPRTRSTKPAKNESTETPTTQASKYELPAPVQTPRQVFILPKQAAPTARIVTLPHPRHGKPSRYLVCPDTGFYEFTKVAAPRNAPRSWFIEPQRGTNLTEKPDEGLETQSLLISNSDMFLATAIDPLFLLVPALAEVQSSKGSDDKKRMFLTSDDYFDKLPEQYSHLSEITRWPATRQLLETRMAVLCDAVEAGDETMFRLAEAKLLDVVVQKAERMIQAGLPKSMEEKFVTKALEAPILAHKRTFETPKIPESEVSTPQTEMSESQSTATDSALSVASQPSTAATSFTEEASAAEVFVAAISASEQVVRLQRFRVAFDFICSSYIPPEMAELLAGFLSDKGKCSIDMSPLHEYTGQLAKLKAEAMASRSMGDFSRKHGRDEEDDEARLEKKRKLEEEKRRKASESRGVRDLKKVNTSGMKKLSHFFQKK